MVQTRRSSFSVPSLPPLGSNAKKTNAKPPLPPLHFLRNVDLDHCSDLLSIPDPPSPPQRNQRRQSSPMLRPLRDVTNEETRKRSRKSLFHVPSPSIEDGPGSDGLDKAAESFTAVEMLGSEEDVLKSDTSVGSIIYFDDDDDDVAVSVSKRHKRRESMTLPNALAPLHQEDSGEHLEGRNQTHEERQAFTDSPTHDVAFELEDHDDDDVDDIVSTRMMPSKRQSMVLPSDVASFQNEVASQVFGHEVITVGLSPEEIDLSDDDETTRTQWPTKRQSMVLPSDVALLLDDETREYFEEVQSHQKEASVGDVPKENSMTDRKMPAKQSLTQEENCVQNMKVLEAAVVATHASLAKEARAGPKDGNETEYIRSLVREYCALPISERHSSKQAEEIERLTSYLLVPPTAKQRKETRNGVDLNWSGSPTDAEGPTTRARDLMPKRELLLTLGALMELIDERKVQDTKQMEAHTQCRFQRSRSGKYRYFHIFTNGKISPAAYEERYLAALVHSKAESQKHIQDWIKRVEGPSQPPCTVGGQVMKLKTGTVVDCEPYRGVQENDEQCSKTLPPTKNVLDQSPHSFGSVDIVTDSSFEPTSALDTSDSSSVVVEKVGGYAQANDTDNRMELVNASSSSPTDSLLLETESQDDSLMLPLALYDEDSPDMLLPLPSRDEASADPAIAAAEATLWAAIDAALETYSRQVIAIREARIVN